MHLYADGKEHLRDDFCQISVVLTLWSGARCPCAVDQQANTHSEHISCSSCWKVCDEGTESKRCLNVFPLHINMHLPYHSLVKCDFVVPWCLQHLICRRFGPIGYIRVLLMDGVKVVFFLC